LTGCQADNRLSQFIFDLQEKNTAGEEDVLKEMKALAEEYGTFSSRSSTKSQVEAKRDGGKTIVSVSHQPYRQTNAKESF
jgi:ATP-dependent RNA circularization protein (DNA/RNA ligase family)